MCSQDGSQPVVPYPLLPLCTPLVAGEKHWVSRWALLREASPIQPHMHRSWDPTYASLGVAKPESSLRHCCPEDLLPSWRGQQWSNAGSCVCPGSWFGCPAATFIPRIAHIACEAAWCLCCQGVGHGHPQLGCVVSFRASCWKMASPWDSGT